MPNTKAQIIVDQYTATAIGWDTLTVQQRIHRLMTLHQFATDQLQALYPILANETQPSSVLDGLVNQLEEQEEQSSMAHDAKVVTIFPSTSKNVA